jgi:hypothetical protein
MLIISSNPDDFVQHSREIIYAVALVPPAYRLRMWSGVLEAGGSTYLSHHLRKRSCDPYLSWPQTISINGRHNESGAATTSGAAKI